MKKITYFIIAVFVITYTACKKDYKCECTTVGPSGTTVTTKDISKTSKSTAKAICGSSTEVYTSSYSSGSSTSNSQTSITNCSLKE